MSDLVFVSGFAAILAATIVVSLWLTLKATDRGHDEKMALMNERTARMEARNQANFEKLQRESGCRLCPDCILPFDGDFHTYCPARMDR